jgi:hypothetical protein
MPTRIHIPKDWKRRATLAMNNLNRPGVAPVCFWCGHQYRRGEYNSEAEADHLLQCAEYPKEARLRMQKRKNAKSIEPNVGIIFLVGKTLLIDRTPVSEGEIYGDFRIHECGHDMYWETLLPPGILEASLCWPTTCVHADHQGVAAAKAMERAA